MPTTEGQPADAGVAGDPTGHGETVGLGGGVEVRQGRPAPDDRPAFVRVDPHAVQEREVDHEPVVTDRRPGEAVSVSADGDLQAVVAAEGDGGGHVARGPASCDQCRLAVDRAVPDRPGVVEARFTGQHDGAGHRTPQPVDVVPRRAGHGSSSVG
jgi:hypothetical protein